MGVTRVHHENTEDVETLRNQLKLTNDENEKLETQLEEADSKFMRLETLLRSTEAELSAVKEDLVNLSNSKQDMTNNDYDPLATQKMVKKILNKIFKQIKTTFSEDNSDPASNKSYSGQDVVDKIEKVETINLGGHADVPGEAVIIKKASISE